MPDWEASWSTAIAVASVSAVELFVQDWPDAVLLGLNSSRKPPLGHCCLIRNAVTEASLLELALASACAA